MKRLCILALLVVSGLTVRAQRPEIVPGDLLVQLREGASIDHVLQDNQRLNGLETQLHAAQFISPPMRVHLLRFDPKIDHNALLQQVFSHPAVSAVQFNHLVQWRDTSPDDPQFDQQWQHLNTGAGGGTAGADVSSTQAWDITTGGVTALGDTIVVCIVDDGISYTHPDLVDNLWINRSEIPGNNIDDDGNGYVDDIYGWNVANNSASVGTGSHGINVAGMAGARGNNTVGVAGVNWNVKLMSVVNGSIGSGSNPNEANVIAAYTYPLIMRQLYHQTGGEHGAFVVATNSSWGINNGNPANAPLWCAFYDTLGAYGILSAGATANAQINVDADGDLPTGCASDYMLSVTATDNNDVRTFSAYGATTVDLGAPGESVRTTSGSNGYTTTDGTSFASPMVAGAVALLYSAPCPSLAAIAHADPELAAQLVRQYLLDGVDVVDDLIGFTVTGGRLNLRGALDELLNDCQEGGCIGALSVTTSAIIDTSATISWNALDAVLTVDLKYVVAGTTDTVTVDSVASPFHLGGLMACTDYWYSLRTHCEEDSSLWSSPRTFRTDGCCEAPAGVAVSGILATNAAVTWTPVLAAIGYDVQYRELGTTEWDVLNTTSAFVTFTGLDSCTWYEVRVATVCDTGSTDFTDIVSFRTLGCGACTDLTYCASVGVTTFEYIGNFSIGDFSNTSGGETGYADFTDLDAIDLHRGETYEVSFTPEFNQGTFTEHFRLWIDVNHNGTFSNANELLFDDSEGSTTTVTGTITVPMNAQLGSARMRVSMAYGAQFGGDYPQTSCENGQDGEVEDYCVNILEELPVDTTGIDELRNGAGMFGLEVFPVPTDGLLTLRLLNDEQPATSIVLLDMQGRAVLQQSVQVGSPVHRLDLSAIGAGIYLVEVRADRTTIGRARAVRR